MPRGIPALLLLLTLTVASVSALEEDSYDVDQLENVDDAIGEAITIKLGPWGHRRKADANDLAHRFKALPALRGAAMAVASRDLLVVVPTTKHSIQEIKEQLLQQPEVHELEIGEKQFRREGDKSYDQLRKDKLEEILSHTKLKVTDKIKENIKKLMRHGRNLNQRLAGKDGGEGEWGGPEEAMKVAKRMALREAKRAERRARRKAAQRERVNAETAEL